MKLLREPRHLSDPARRGAALMLAFLILFVLLAIVFQIHIGTQTQNRVTRNNISLTAMDSAISATLLQVVEDLKADAESGGSEGGPESLGSAMSGAGGLGALGGAAGGADGGGEAGGEGGEATDSRQDDWARPQRTEVNRVQMRLLVQDEDSKYNVLCVLTEDEEEAEKARDRLIRILDRCRENTRYDIDSGDARDMVEDMVEHMKRRSGSTLPRTKLRSDDEETPEIGLPLTLREFVVLPHFDPSHFRDFRDEDGAVVHSIGSFLTVWTALSTQEEVAGAGSQGGALGGGGVSSGGDSGGTGPSSSGGGPSGGGSQGFGVISATNASTPGDGGGAGGSEGGQAPGELGGASGAGEQPAATGVAVNVNTAPPAVLHSLMDERDVDSYFWGDLVQYRNDPEEDQDDYFSDEEPLIDFETGEEIITPKIFDSLDELSEISGWESIEPIAQAELEVLLKTSSSVFSVFVTARVRTDQDDGEEWFSLDAAETREEEERKGGLVRTVRAVFWRRSGGEGEVQLVPLESWEVLDYVPYEVRDYPEEDMYYR